MRLLLLFNTRLPRTISPIRNKRYGCNRGNFKDEFDGLVDFGVSIVIFMLDMALVLKVVLCCVGRLRLLLLFPASSRELFLCSLITYKQCSFRSSTGVVRLYSLMSFTSYTDIIFIYKNLISITIYAHQ